MFNYFNGGIINTIPQKQIDFSELLELIKNNPHRTLINRIRLLRQQGNNKFKVLKRSLPFITPNCLVKKRSVKNEVDFQSNFISPSGYLYIDIDFDNSNPQTYKENFISRYGHLVAGVFLSTSMGGISVLFKLKNPPTNNSEFELAWNVIKYTILKDELIDEMCSDFGRAMIITYDPDPYYNFENEIDTNDYLNEYYENTKGIIQPILYDNDSIYRLNETFFKIPIDDVFKKLNLKTEVSISNPIVELYPVDYTDVRFPRIIKDGTKHKIYTGMIHSLVYLNPNVEPDYIFRYMVFINNQFADPLMEYQKLESLFRFIYESIKNNSDYEFQNIRIKNVHFNNNSGLTGDEKRRIAGEINGKIRRNNTIQRIEEARQYLLSNNKKVTCSKLAEISGVAISTVKRRYKEKAIDLVKLVDSFNVRQEEYTHPDCPQWVLDFIQSDKSEFDYRFIFKNNCQQIRA